MKLGFIKAPEMIALIKSLDIVIEKLDTAGANDALTGKKTEKEIAKK